MSETQRVKVWDGATRLFHWLLVFLLASAWITAERGQMEWHFRCGYAIGALLIFRIVWGFVGSETSRFSHFLASPFAAVRHLLHLTRREPDDQVGHNAAGGWMVLVMLGLVTAQVITGLCGNDEAGAAIGIEGPLARFVGKDMSDTSISLHYRIFKLIQLAVVAHIGAIAAYAILKRHNLLHPMLSGHKLLPIDTQAPHITHPLRAWAIFAVAAAIMFGVSRL